MPRLFAVLVPPDAVLREVAAALTTTDDGLRYVAGHQRHLTLAFYGEVPDDRVDDLRDRLTRAAHRTPPLYLRLENAGTFPANPRRARVLWLGVSGDVDGLRRLAERCAAAGKRAGLDLEDRRYRPHLTLARARHDQADATAAVAALDGFATTTWTATHLRLVRSHLGSTVTHETIAEPELNYQA